MLFNSLSFFGFFIVVFICYWFVFNKNLKAQNFFLFVASYFFYGCWDWRFVFLLAFSTFLDYYSGLRIEGARSARARKMWLLISVVINLGFLGFFKYYNFFITSFMDLAGHFGWKTHYATLNIILPVGISFYTFHGLSYVFDIYNGRIKARRDPIAYALFVSFFPLLVAGPIERATHLLPQVEKERTFDYAKAVDGLRQVLWGLFKKMVIADNCAKFANLIFENPSAHSGSTLVLGALFFTFQIYGDFSGYSDMALGFARLLGFELLQNFRFPYFSRDIAEFWRRWHISLSSWFKDYLYIPLGGSRGNNFTRIRNTFIIFLVSGFWHGANWTFVVWGALNALYIMPSIIFKTNRNNLNVIAEGRFFPGFREFFEMVVTFALTVIAWIFFRAETLGKAFAYLKGICSRSLFSAPELSGYGYVVLGLVGLFMFIEWMGREKRYALDDLLPGKPRIVRWTCYAFIIFLIGMFAETGETPFIYFQF